MSAEMSFDRALGAVADGQAVDWDAVERVARDDGERERVRCLRLLGEIGEVHRTVDPTEDGPRAVPLLREPTAPRPRTPLRRTFAAERKAERRADPRVSPLNSMADTLDSASGPTSAPRWGRYHLVEKVGAGGFGQVYRAWDPDLERELAIKILHTHIADGGARERLRHEGRALARIRQTNVVNVLGVEVHEGRAALCMEFVRGQTLDELVRTRGTFSAREAVLIGEDVCRALSAVHRAGYLHRDVKAKNVMREQAGRIVLMDFGTGREEQAPGRVGSDMTGTPLYMAPEVLAGRPASMRSDVYSVGVLLFNLVTGAYPVQARGTSELRLAHRDGRRRFLAEWRSDLPAGFVRVVDRAIAPAPEDRYPNAAALLEALGSVLADEDTASTRGHLLRRIAMGGLGLVTLAGVLGIINTLGLNVTLGRSGEFALESPLDVLAWGLRSMVLPAVLLVTLCAILTPLTLAGRLLVRLVPGLRARTVAASARVARVARTLGLDDVNLIAMWATGVIAAAIAVAAWRFAPLLSAAFTVSISDAPLDRFERLSPAWAGLQDLYRLTFSLIVVLAIVAGWLVRRMALRQRHVLARGTLVSAFAVFGLAVLLLDAPYRLFVHAEFEAADWNGVPCYVTGEGANDVLVFCPTLDAPRSHVEAKSSSSLRRLRRTENIFTPLAARVSPAR